MNWNRASGLLPISPPIRLDRLGALGLLPRLLPPAFRFQRGALGVVRDADGGESIGIHSVGNLTMSWDHRAVDGAYAAAFLARAKEIIETRDWSAEL